MKLPWNQNDEEKERRIQELEQRIEEIEDEKESYRKRFEAEKERRSELSRKKQEAEEELNRLKDRLEAEKERNVEETETETVDMQETGFGKTKKLLGKLGTLESNEDDLITIYSPGKLENHPRLKDIKNSVNKEQFRQLKGRKNFIAFLDQDTGSHVIELSPFYQEKLDVSGSFETDIIIEFLESEKYWLLVTVGDTRLFREEDGDHEEVDRVSGRIEKKHSKGGFSQQRFERKRNEQIEGHIKQVAEMVNEYDLEEVYVLGDQRICEDLPGQYLGGFDPNRDKPEQFYGFQLLQF